MNEIGSEFWNVPLSKEENHLFPNDTKWFLSGRVALKYIIKEIKIKKSVKNVAIPSWCCDSMIIPFISEGIDVCFYSVTMLGGKLSITIDVETDILLVMDYFGINTDQNYSNYHGIVIRDLTHSIFSNVHTDADYYFGSLRKWCGIWTGGFAWSKENFSIKPPVFTDANYIQLRAQAMKYKLNYINGNINRKLYLEIFEKAENILEKKEEIEEASIRDINIARYIDVEFIKRKRKSNAKIIEDILDSQLILPKSKQEDCPLFIPIILENRNEIKKKLMDNHIYCPIHWPISVNHKLTFNQQYVYDHELSLICDQRYSEDDMVRLCEIIRKG